MTDAGEQEILIWEFCTNEEFLYSLYRLFLAREPLHDEIADALQQLNNGTSRMQLLTAFVASHPNGSLSPAMDAAIAQQAPSLAEFLQQYRELLRESTPEAKSDHSASHPLQEHPHDEEKRQRIRMLLQRDNVRFVSDESLPLYRWRDLSDWHFISALYRELLAREPDTHGLLHWQQILISGRSRIDIVRGFIETGETLYVSSLLEQALLDFSGQSASLLTPPAQQLREGTPVLHGCQIFVHDLLPAPDTQYGYFAAETRNTLSYRIPEVVDAGYQVLDFFCASASPLNTLEIFWEWNHSRQQALRTVFRTQQQERYLLFLPAGCQILHLTIQSSGERFLDLPAIAMHRASPAELEALLCNPIQPNGVGQLDHWRYQTSANEMAHEIRHARYQQAQQRYYQYLRQHGKYALWQLQEEPQEPTLQYNDADRTILFSILMPVYNPDGRFLRAAVLSVLSQSYPRLELILIDDHSSSAATQQILEELDGSDPRLRIHRCEKNSGISSATNVGLQQAQGEWIAFMDHDDLLAENALSNYYQAIRARPEITLLYCDEDHINEEGFRVHPFFKADFNLTRLEGHNYITHFLCIKAGAFTDELYFRPETDGAQDYDFLLRLLRCGLDAEHCRHIEKILYHWREHAQSTAKSLSAKPYCVTATRRALESYIRKETIPHSVRLIRDTAGHIEIDFARYQTPLVEIIIPFRDQAQVTQSCLNSLLEKTSYPNYHITLINNLSTEAETLSFIARSQKLSQLFQIIDYPKPFNWSAINNLAARSSAAKYFLFLNNDTEIVDPHWLQELLSAVSRPQTAIAGCLLLYPDYSIQHAGVILTRDGPSHLYCHAPHDCPGDFGELLVRRDVSAVTGACMIVARDAFWELGGFCEEFPIAYNDIDFCLQAGAAGYRVVFTPHTHLLHLESKSRGYDSETPQKQRRQQQELRAFRGRWEAQLQRDPHHSAQRQLLD